jgi:hypothetical protein
MTFLDDLKRQASALQATRHIDQAALSRNTALVEAAANEAARYLMELGKQLEVLRPVSKVSYSFDKKTQLTGLPMVDFRFDARRKRLREQDLTDHISFSCMIRAREPVTLRKDFVPDSKRLEARIWQSGGNCQTETIRDPESGHFVEMRYVFVPEVRMALRIVPNHDAGTLRLSFNNLDELETVECEFAPHELGQSRRLDELARWWLGEPNRFLDGAAQLRRIEAR